MERIIERIAADFGIIADYKKLDPLNFSFVKELADTVVFVPGSDMFFKHWLLDYWLKLSSELLKLQVPVAVLGRAEESSAVKALIQSGLNWHETKTLPEAIDAISSCKAVVTVDTGLMHLAIHQGKFTIALMHRAFFYERSANNCINLFASICDPLCKVDTSPGADVNDTTYFDFCVKVNPLECSMPANKACMSAILPDDVLKQLLPFLSL